MDRGYVELLQSDCDRPFWRCTVELVRRLAAEEEEATDRPFGLKRILEALDAGRVSGTLPNPWPHLSPQVISFDWRFAAE